MKKIEQEFVRWNLIRFLKETKTKQKDIANEVGIPQDVLSRFKNGNRNQFLWTDHLIKLADYLADKGYNQDVFKSVEVDKFVNNSQAN